MRTLSGIYRYRTINSHEKVEFQFFKKFKWGEYHETN